MCYQLSTSTETAALLVNVVNVSGLKSLYQKLGDQPFGAHWSSTFNSASPYVTSGRYGNASAWAGSEAGTSVVPLASPVWDHIFRVSPPPFLTLLLTLPLTYFLLSCLPAGKYGMGDGHD